MNILCTNLRNNPRVGQWVHKIFGQREGVSIIWIVCSVAFFFGLNLFDFSAAAQLTSPAGEGRAPLAFATLRWQSSKERYEGVAVYEIRSKTSLSEAEPFGPGPDGARFVLYPNRSLGWATESRRDREFNAVGYPGEDIWSMERTGAMVLKSVEWVGQGAEACNSDMLSAIAQGDDLGLGREPAKVALNRSETILDVYARGSEAALRGATCSALRIAFDYVPPRSAGNFGMLTQQAQLFSGPIVPYPFGEFHRTQLSLEGVFAACLQCQTTKDGKVVQVYESLPSPIHIDIERPVIAEPLEVGGLRIGLIGDWSNLSRTVLLERITNAVAEESLRVPLGLTRSGFHFFIAANTLEEKLVFAQVGELQLGRSLFKISPLLEKYHEGAFERELLILLYQSSFLEFWRPNSWRDWRLLASVSKMVARSRLRERVGDLDALKEFSNQFDFIPFFDDILRGRALQNNDAFLGIRESPTLVDSQPSEIIMGTLSTEELRIRIEHCSGIGQTASLEDWLVKKWLVNRSSLSTLRQHLSSLPWNGELCPFGLLALFERRPVRENFLVERYDSTSRQSRLRFQREIDEPYEVGLFVPDQVDYIGSGVFRDTPKILFGAENSKALKSKIWQPIGMAKEILDYEFDDDHHPSGRIEEPTLSSSDEMQVFPRETKLRVTGLKFSFDSTAEEFQVSSGLDFLLLGDEYYRSLNFGFTLGTIEQRASLGFRMDAAPLFGVSTYGSDTKDEVASSLDFFRSLPFDLGIEQEFPDRDPESTSIVFGIGANNYEGDPLVSQGLSLGARYRWKVLQKGEFESGFLQEYSFGYDQAMGPMTTLAIRPLLGFSTEKISLADYVPGFGRIDVEASKATEYLAIRTELRGVIASRFNWNLLDNLLFQDLVLYGSHSAAVDSRILTAGDSLSDMLQSVEVGFRLFGAVFGAKNQSLGLSIIRTISQEPRNSFALTVGRN